VVFKEFQVNSATVALMVVILLARVPNASSARTNENEATPVYSIEFNNIGLSPVLREYGRVSGVSVSNAVRQSCVFTFSIDNASRDTFLRRIEDELKQKGIILIAVTDEQYVCVGDFVTRPVAHDQMNLGAGQALNLWVSSRRQGDLFCQQVKREDLFNAPTWDPAVMSCPLSMGMAMSLAFGSMTNAFPETADWKLDSVSLNRFWYGNHWYYQFQFGKEVRQGWRHPDTISVVVLLNGWTPKYTKKVEGKNP